MRKLARSIFETINRIFSDHSLLDKGLKLAYL